MKKLRECYLAEWRTPNGASSQCLFTSLDPAIFFVLSGIGFDVDWDNFPDTTKKYPYEDRTGNEKIAYSPVFRIEQLKGDGKTASGSVTKMGIADSWTVGNGIAEACRRWFRQATGKDAVVLSGAGDKLTGTIQG